MRRARLLLLGAVLVAVLGLGGCSSGTDAATAAATPVGPTLAGYERDPAPNVADISLPASNRDGAEFNFQAEPGGLLLVYFGFTSCPDICPTTLSDVRIAFNELGTTADDIELAFVTVDPERDTDEVVTIYSEAFIDDAIALRTDDDTALAIAADAFGATYRVTTDDNGEPFVEHSGHVFIVDDAGTLALTWPHGVQVDDMVNDLSILVERARL